ncbi:MAG: carbohydrate kinase family protein [Christensenellaceae bacterium]|nr:carbohydrate kinase family protein [Christensenellaceae bacterium]
MPTEYKADLVCVGISVVDCIINGYTGEKLSERSYISDSVSLQPGGEAVNVSVAAAKLGLNIRAVSGIGADKAGDVILTELKGAGVDTSDIIVKDDFRTPVAVIFVDGDGNRVTIISKAHRQNFRPDLDLGYLDSAPALSLGSLFRAPFNDPEVLYTVLKGAKDRGMTTYVDTKMPNSDIKKLDDLRDSLPLIDYIFPNEDEAAYYSGCVRNEDMAGAFLEKGVKNVIVKLGAKGCFFMNGEESITVPGLKADAVDATGAGDNFIAGFIASLREGKDIKEALAFANACGAVCTLAVGATAGLKNKEQVLKYLKSNK